MLRVERSLCHVKYYQQALGKLSLVVDIGVGCEGKLALTGQRSRSLPKTMSCSQDNKAVCYRANIEVKW